ncbi:hypothetical protein ACMYR2_3253 [Nitrobacter sp. TKz-YC01]
MRPGFRLDRREAGHRNLGYTTVSCGDRSFREAGLPLVTSEHDPFRLNRTML